MSQEDTNDTLKEQTPSANTADTLQKAEAKQAAANNNHTVTEQTSTQLDASANTPRITSVDEQFIAYLQANCRTIDFFQIIRFLYRFVKKVGLDPITAITITPPIYARRVPVEQVLSINRTSRYRFEVEYNDLAIYGTYGCLPESFTKRLNQYEQSGRPEPKAFIDIFQSYISHLQFRSQLSNQSVIKIIEFGDMEAYRRLLHLFIGVTADFLEFDNDVSAWLKYHRLLTSRVRNSIGLQYLLDQFFLDRDIQFAFSIEEACLIRENEADAKLPAIGSKKNYLGRNSYVGSIFQNTQSCLRFHFSLNSVKQYYEFIYSDLIHTFVKLALAYCRVEYACIFRFDEISDVNTKELNDTDSEPQIQLGASTILHDETLSDRIIIQAHEFVYTENLRQHNNERPTSAKTA